MKCKRLVYQNYPQANSPSVLLGVIVEEDKEYLKFRTAKRELLISRSLVIALEDTNIDFYSEGGNDDNKL